MCQDQGKSRKEGAGKFALTERGRETEGSIELEWRKGTGVGTKGRPAATQGGLVPLYCAGRRCRGCARLKSAGGSERGAWKRAVGATQTGGLSKLFRF